MVVLIAESKTMLSVEVDVATCLFERHIPRGEGVADEIMAHIARLTVGEIIEISRYSPSMASRLLAMAHEFPNKTLGLKAIEAYTGVVFKHFDYPTLSGDEKESVNDRVKIVSSLYGLLNADDIIKPYRLDYSTRLSPDDSPLNRFHRQSVTEALIDEIDSSGSTEVLNLMPADAEKCIEWKAISKHAAIWKVDFKEHDGGHTRSPHATRLKAMRGALLRAVITNRLCSAEHIGAMASELMMPDFIDHDKGIIYLLV